MKNWKKGLALALALMMLVTLLPAAMAADSKKEMDPNVWTQRETVSSDELMQMVSLVPLEKKDTQADFSTYTPPEARQLKLSDILKGQNVSPDAKIAWSVNYGDNYKVGGLNDTVGINDNWSNHVSCVVGSALQLDDSNVFYDVELKMGEWDEWLIPTIAVPQGDGSRVSTSVRATSYYAMYYNDGRVESEFQTEVDHGVLQDGDTVYVALALNPAFATDRFDTVELYSGETDVTAAVWNADPTVDGNGLPVQFEKWDNGSGLKITLKKDGVVVGEDTIHLYMSELYGGVSWSSLYKDGADGYHEYVTDRTDHQVINEVSYRTATLYREYPANGKYYQRFYYNWNREEANDRVEMAVVGKYDTKEAALAAGAADIKDELFGEKGYLGDFSGDGIVFTIFADGIAYQEGVKTVDGEHSKSSSGNTYYRVQGAASESGSDYGWTPTYDGYVIDNHDNYYDQGFQTVLVLDSDLDLSAVVPVFYSYDDTTVYAGSPAVKQESGKNVHNFANGPVQYSVSAKDGKNVGNYWVTFVKKDTSGAKLFVNAVNGPDGAKRELFLNSYAGKSHDIFIANVGSQPLTGLKAELSADAKNVKLDEYWTVGGAGNDSLAAFTTANVDYSKHGELPNVAKIRVLPDGNGAISGTLTISAAGQEPVAIALTGVAGDPTITTTEIPVGVKYVPYGTMIQTTNMYDWNKVTFKMTSGSLPAGVELKENGEIYGVPQEAGSFTFKVQMKNSYSGFSSVTAEYTLEVGENTDENVDAQTDEGYFIQVRVPDFTVYTDQEFKIEGALSEFIDLWLDGQKLERGVDYTAEEGSTKATILQNTFQNVGGGSHTLAAEFRLNGDLNQDLKKAAQNYNAGKSSTPAKTPAKKPTTSKAPAAPQVTVPAELEGIKVGDKVQFTGVGHYYTANSKLPKNASGCEAKVTAIYPTGTHPIHVIGKSVYGWVDVADVQVIVSETAPAAPGEIAKGAKVTVNAEAKSYTGEKLAWFVYNTTYTVIEVKDERVVIGLNGVATAALNISDLSLAD